MYFGAFVTILHIFCRYRCIILKTPMMCPTKKKLCRKFVPVFHNSAVSNIILMIRVTRKFCRYFVFLSLIFIPLTLNNVLLPRHTTAIKPHAPDHTTAIKPHAPEYRALFYFVESETTQTNGWASVASTIYEFDFDELILDSSLLSGPIF